MTFSDYIDYLRDKRIGVIGFGVSNQPLVRVLLRSGCDVTVCDRRERAQLSTAGDEAAAQGAKFILGADYLEHLDFDVIFRTPGVLPIVPQLRKAAQNGAILTSEMEAFCNLCPCRILAITGSDGKTTTSTITAELLRAQGHTVHLGGNIGTPLFDRIPDIRPEDFAVLELSSFQLHSMHCAPDVAIITNISPNHLDVHPDFEDYVSAKCSIYRGQRPDGVLVLNAKDAHTPRFAAEAPGHVRYFSSIGPVKNGVYCADDVIYRAHDGVAEKILNADEIRIPGAHNVENYMAAFAATDGLVGNAACIQVAHTFSGVPHRMERIRELNAEWRGRDVATDVISLECERPDDPDLAPGEPCELGDIVLAPDYIARQAARFGTTAADEFRLLLVHGTLHLLGYDHLEDDEAEVMEAREDALLALLPHDGATRPVTLTRHREGVDE